jgi:hypothetical protein
MIRLHHFGFELSRRLDFNNLSGGVSLIGPGSSNSRIIVVSVRDDGMTHASLGSLQVFGNVDDVILCELEDTAMLL